MASLFPDTPSLGVIERQATWSQTQLSKKAGVGHSTVRRMENVEGVVSGHIESVIRIRNALEEAGVIFIEQDEEGGAGVRLKGPSRT